MNKPFLFIVILGLINGAYAGQMSHHQAHNQRAVTKQVYHQYLNLGDTYAAKEQPQKALDNYSIVYHQAMKDHNRLFQRIALFKIARMELWLGYPQAATNTYQQLLSMSLSKEDRALARAGLQSAKHNQQQQSNKERRQSYEKTLEQAREANYSEKGALAFSLIKHHLRQKKDARVYLIAADSMAFRDKPRQALDFYQQALDKSHDNALTVSALFGIAKMQFWLGRYVAAEKTYRKLLTLRLNSQDHELALAGQVKSLAYYNRPRTAYQTIPPQIRASTPDLVIAAAQASSWSNWSDITQSILNNNHALLNKLNPASSLAKDVQDLQWQTRLATDPNILSPSVFYSHDSEHFDKLRSTVGYSRYWNQLAQTTVGLDYIVYTQNKPNQLNASGIYIGQTLRPTRDVIVQGQIEPTEYKNLTPSVANNWSPFLWNANATYTPNDYLSLRALALTEVVETFPAFSQHITDNQYAAGATLNPLPYVQLNGSYARLNFSDTNSRNSGFISATVGLLPSYGISATGLLRGFETAFSTPNYFSPHQYWADSLLFKMSRKFGATWHYYVDGGLGQQYIIAQANGPTASSPTYQWGLGITGPINRWLILNAYYADVQQASAYLDSPGYHYQYGGFSLNILL